LITYEDVLYAYRLILGREPENKDVIESYLHTIHSLRDLRSEFIKSPEFVELIGKLLDNPQFVRQRHPFHLPKIPVEVYAGKEILDQMFERLCDTWEGMGFTEPYWSVLTQPQYKIENFIENSQQFYSSSGPLFRNMMSTLNRNGINVSSLDNCLEVGCGVGRMTAHLAGNFNRVIGADVSLQHILKAKSYLDSIKVENVEFIHWQKLDQLNGLANIDFIVSLITLQHNPPPLILKILEKLLSSLNPGGFAFIQIPTYRNGYIFEVERYMQKKSKGEIEMHFLPQSHIFDAIKKTNCSCVEVREDAMVGNEDKMLSNTFLIKKEII